MTGVYQPGVMAVLPVRAGANVRPAPMQMNLQFNQVVQRLPTLVLGFFLAASTLAQTLVLTFTDPAGGTYEAGPIPVAGNYAAGSAFVGNYTISDYHLTIAVELTLGFLTSQLKQFPAGFSGQSLLFQFTQAYYVAQNFPPPVTMLANFRVSPSPQLSLRLNFPLQTYQAGTAVVVASPGTYETGPSGTLPIGTVLTADPPYAIGFVVPGTAADDRIGALIIGEVVL